MREARRLALIRRQALIATVARRQALRGLADALEAEARSHALAARSRALVASSAPQPGATVGAVLAARAGFTAALAQLAGTADAAAGDATRQSEWQAESFAAAETRSRRLAEREAEARAAFETLKLRREQARSLPLARKLHF